MSKFQVVEIVVGSADRKVYQVYFGSTAIGEPFTSKEKAFAFMELQELLEEAKQMQREFAEESKASSRSSLRMR